MLWLFTGLRLCYFHSFFVAEIAGLETRSITFWCMNLLWSCLSLNPFNLFFKFFVLLIDDVVLGNYLSFQLCYFSFVFVYCNFVCLYLFVKFIYNDSCLTWEWFRILKNVYSCGIIREDFWVWVWFKLCLQGFLGIIDLNNWFVHLCLQSF